MREMTHGCPGAGESPERRERRSWFRMIRGVRMAAGFLGGLEFHELDAGHVRIVDVEGPFAVAADLGFVGGPEAVSAENGDRGLDVFDGEREMILDAALVVIGV